LAALLTLTSAFVFYEARVGRMDILVAALVLAALVAYGAAVKRGFAPAWITTAGWLFGLAVLLHTLGIVPAVGLAIALLVERRPRVLKSFLWPLALCLAAWVSYTLLDWRSFQDQVSLQSSHMPSSFIQPFTTNKAHLPAFAIGAVALVALALGSARRDPLARAVVITGLALSAGVVYGRGEQYFVYVFPLFASCLPALIQWAARRHFAWVVVGVVLLVSIAEGAHDAQSVVSGAPSRGEFESEITHAVAPGKPVFIGPGGGGAYFALIDRNRMSSRVALNLEEGPRLEWRGAPTT
jgi:4-amino-4-deoxy-L-arabinose transferase-like glycosyltransferase